MAAASPVRNTVATVLTEQRASLDQFVEQEISKINGLTCRNIELANEVGLALDNTFNTFDYLGLLTKLADEVDEVAAKKLEQIKEMVTDLKSQQPMVLANLPSRAIKLTESFVLKGWQPKLLGFSAYVYVSNVGESKIPFSGRFKYGASHPELCVLTVPDATAKLEKAEEGCLTYKVMNNLLKEKPDASLKFCHFTKVKLEVSYNVGNVRTSLKTATYYPWIGAFPLRACEIGLTTWAPMVIETKKQRFSSLEMSLTRQGQVGEIKKEVNIMPTLGWKITSKPQLIQDDVAEELEAKDGGVAVLLKLSEGQDRVTAHVEFDEEKDVIEPGEVTKEIHLGWGETHYVEASKFKANVKGVDGQVFQIEAPGHEKFLKVVPHEKGYKLIAEIPIDK